MREAEMQNYKTQFGISDEITKEFSENKSVQEWERREALALRSRLIGDKACVDRWYAGGREEKKQMALVNIILSPPTRADGSPPK
jgi:hypothetical protein